MSPDGLAKAFRLVLVLSHDQSQERQTNLRGNLSSTTVIYQDCLSAILCRGDGAQTFQSITPHIAIHIPEESNAMQKVIFTGWKVVMAGLLERAVKSILDSPILVADLTHTQAMTIQPRTII